MENITNELSNESLFSINRENISNYLDVSMIDIEKELGLISPTLAKKSVWIDKNGKAFVGSDPVTVKISKSGNIYYLLKKKFVKGLLARAISTAIYNAGIKLEEIEMGSVSIVKFRTKAGAEIFAMVGKGVYKLMTEASAKVSLQRFYYSKMADETEKLSSKVFEPEEETIYEGVEDFQDRTAEIEETIQVVLSMRNRKLLFEEREALKELLSEINALI